MKPNIIWITFDSGRPDHLSFNGYNKKTTPFLDSLAARSAYFNHAYATGPGSSVSFVGMFTSTYPLDHGGYTFIDRPRVLLPEALQEAGYTTVGIHSSPYLSSYFGYGRGWDKFLYLNYFAKANVIKSSANPGTPPVMSRGLQDGTTKSNILKKNARIHKWMEERMPPIAVLYKILEKAALFFRKVIKDAIKFRPAFFIAEKINAQTDALLEETAGRPLFLWVHYLDAHAPYGLFGKTGHGLRKKLRFYASDWAAFLFGDFPSIHKFFMPLHRSLYDDSLHYVDKNIKDLFAMLDKRGILNDEAMVVINADHGEEFLDHGGYGHLQRLYNVNAQVPLIVRAPGMLSEPKVIERPVSLIDLAPTMLDFAGAKHPDSYRGMNLFNEPSREVVIQASESAGDLTNTAFTGTALVYNGYKLIHWKNKKMLFALSDRDERHDLYAEHPEIVEDMEERIKKYAPTKRQA